VMPAILAIPISNLSLEVLWQRAWQSRENPCGSRQCIQCMRVCHSWRMSWGGT